MSSSFELNLMYLRNSRGLIIAAEAAFALLGGIISSVLVMAGFTWAFSQFTFWTTCCISATIVLLNICNVYEKLHSKFGRLLTQIELCYIGLWFIFYAIATVLSFFDWDGSDIIAYIEFVLFAVDGYFHFLDYNKPKAESTEYRRIMARQYTSLAAQQEQTEN